MSRKHKVNGCFYKLVALVALLIFLQYKLTKSVNNKTFFPLLNLVLFIEHAPWYIDISIVQTLSIHPLEGVMDNN